jgi:S1-C subfamily serine protease
LAFSNARSQSGSFTNAIYAELLDFVRKTTTNWRTTPQPIADMRPSRGLAPSVLLSVTLGLLAGCVITTDAKLESTLKRYRGGAGHKAFALARDLSGAAAWGDAFGQSTVEEARSRALASCRAARQTYTVQSECVIYAVNDLFLGTATSEDPNRLTSAIQDKQTKLGSFGFSRILFRIPTGRRLGTHYERAGTPGLLGLVTVARSTYVWEGDASFGRPEEFRLSAIEELKNVGLPVLGADNRLFGEDTAWKANYQLGGEISEIVLNTYAPAFKSSYSESGITVDWQLFDSVNDKVVFSTRTTGNAKIQGVTREVVALAFRSAVRQLAGMGDFAAALERRLETPNVARTQRTLKLTCEPSDSRPLPQGLDTAMQGVVVVRVGGGHGSGFLISPEGYIVTAAHVVEGADRVQVTSRSGLEFDGEVLRLDKARDVALLKVPGRGYRCLHLAPTEFPAVGTDIYAIGAPSSVELAYSVSKGVVSGMREVGKTTYLQTDASLNRGNSGGPLLDPTGKVLGMVSWKIGGAEGIAFGVPVVGILDGLDISLNDDRP